MIYKKIMDSLDNGLLDEVLTSLKACNTTQLAGFLSTYPSVSPLLASEFFANFWRERRDNLRIPSVPDFRFMKHETLSDADFVTGYLLFLHSAVPAKQVGGEGQDKHMKPTDYLSFHLIFKKLHHLYKSMESDGDLKKLAAVLYNLESFAKLHGCPGFLLLANGYLQLAVRYQAQGERDISQDAYKLCWKYLHLAQLSEIDYAAAINNAYFGKGLSLSNPLRLETIDEMKSHCSDAAESLLSITARAGAEREAKYSYHPVDEPRMSPRM